MANWLLIGPVGIAIDLVVLWALWRARGKPLPTFMRPMRQWRFVGWFLSRLESPVLIGF